MDISHDILVDLDALLDTRLGALYRLDENLGKRMLENPAYYTRANDDLSLIDPDIDIEKFREIYKNRGLEVLSEAIMTPAVLSLSSIVLDLEKQRLETPHVKSVAVTLNAYPYHLDAEQTEMLEAAIAHYIPYDVKITTRRISPDELTPSDIKSNYTGLIIYDLARWFLINGKDLEKVKIPAVTVLAPKIHAGDGKAFTSDDVGPELQGVDPYELIERFSSPYLGLELVDVEVFSVIRPEKIGQHLKHKATRVEA